ncbi:MAG: hypothetical protein QW590_00035 [Candidatus Bilamarchaeaceae archaeon]
MVIMVESFLMFAKKVLDAAKKGGLSQSDLKKLARLLANDRKRYAILAVGLVSALKRGATQNDIKRVSALFEKAAGRIANEKKPFTKEEAEELKRIFTDAGISIKASRWVSRHVDDLLANEIQAFISGKKPEFVPSKKLVSLEREKELQKESGREEKRARV